MACLAADGCNIGFIRSSELPGLGDDACDTNDNGQFLCIGSYWLYDPALPGASSGLCERLFVQTGDECNMAEWLEVAIPSIVEEAVDPVNGVDCCPPGSLWHNTTSDDYFISLNVNGSCVWCQICREFYPTARMTYVGGTQVLIEANGFTLLDIDSSDADDLGEVAINLPHGTYTATEAGTYVIDGILNVRLLEGSPVIDGYLMTLVFSVNGVPTGTVAQQGSGRVDATLGFRDLVTSGAVSIKLNAGDVVSYMATWVSDPDVNVVVTLAGGRISRVA